MLGRSVLLALATFVAGYSHGAMLACNASYSLAQLSGNNVVCTFDGTTLAFSNFVVSGGTITGDGHGVAAPLSNMLVSIFALPTSGPYDFFGGGFRTSLYGGVIREPLVRRLDQNQQYSITFQYDVAILGGGIYAAVNGANGPFCYEPACDSSWSMVTDINAPQGPFVGDGNLGQSATPPDIANFPAHFFGIERIDLIVPERNGFTVRNSLTASANLYPNGLDDITNVLSSPEPATISLVGLSLLALVGYKRVLRTL